MFENKYREVIKRYGIQHILVDTCLGISFLGSEDSSYLFALATSLGSWVIPAGAGSNPSIQPETQNSQEASLTAARIQMLISPEKFAAQINDMFAGEFRYISTADVIDMTKCGLIGCYQYYNVRSDGEIIRRVLQYEKLREGRLLKIAGRSKVAKPKCKSCRKSLPAEPVRKVGRPKKYCPGCESSRSTERYREWRKRRRQLEHNGL